MTDILSSGLGPNSNRKWGDQDDLEDFDRDMSQEITTESIPDADGSIRKTVVEYKTNEKGQTVKIIKRIKMYKTKVKINRRVEERKKWKKFGECANQPKGTPEPGITSIGDEVFIDLVSNEEQGEVKQKKDVVNLGIVCRNCGKTGDHWTLKCPYFKSGASGAGLGMVGLRDGGAEDTGRSGSRGESSPSISSGGDGKYVPPSARRGASASASSDTGARNDARDGRPRDEAATIRVTNLSEDTKEQDLSELFKSFGPISRIYLAKDKVSGLSKGFAFINFVYREDAARAIEKLSGKFGYDHLILHLEWAKPSNK